MAQRSPVRAVRRRNRRLTRLLVHLAYAGAVIVAVAQVIAALGEIIDFVRRILGALGLGASSWVVAGLCEPRHAPEHRAAPMPAMVRPPPRRLSSRTSAASAAGQSRFVTAPAKRSSISTQ